MKLSVRFCLVNSGAGQNTSQIFVYPCSNDIHPFNKSGRHIEFLINDVIRGELSAATLYDLITPHRSMSTEETKKGQSQLLYPVPIVLIR